MDILKETMPLLCLGECGFERGSFITKNAPKHVSFGRLMFDSEKHRATILLQFLYDGMFICKPDPDKHPCPPYIKGDIKVELGKDQHGNPVHHWCGFVYTECKDNRNGIYIGVLKMIPVSAIANLAVKAITEKTTLRDGIWLSIWLEDHEPKGKV